MKGAAAGNGLLRGVQDFVRCRALQRVGSGENMPAAGLSCLHGGQHTTSLIEKETSCHW
jgi:hypothetical protein